MLQILHECNMNTNASTSGTTLTTNVQKNQNNRILLTVQKTNMAAQDDNSTFPVRYKNF